MINRRIGPYFIIESYNLLSPGLAYELRVGVDIKITHGWDVVYRGLLFDWVKHGLEEGILFETTSGAQRFLMDFRMPDKLLDEWESVGCLLPSDVGLPHFCEDDLDKAKSLLSSLKIDVWDRTKAVAALKLSGIFE